MGNKQGGKGGGGGIEKQLAKCMADGVKEAKLKESFDALDKDKNGGLDPKEFKEFASAYIEMVKKKLADKNITQELSINSDEELDLFINKLFVSIDSDRNGSISWPEFLLFIQSDFSDVVLKAKNTKPSCVKNITLHGLDGSGRTCLVNRFANGQWVPDYQIHTIGIDIKNIETDTHTVRLRIWDLPNDCLKGSLKERANLWRGAAGVIICIDLSVQFLFQQKLLTEVKEIRSICKTENVPMIVAGTKADLPRGPYSEDVEKFAKAFQIKYVEVSAKDNDNVDKVFLELTKEMLKASKV